MSEKSEKPQAPAEAAPQKAAPSPAATISAKPGESVSLAECLSMARTYPVKDRISPEDRKRLKALVDAANLRAQNIVSSAHVQARALTARAKVLERKASERLMKADALLKKIESKVEAEAFQRELQKEMDAARE